MSHLQFLLVISPLLVGCGGEVCGPAGAPEFGLVVTGASVSIAYGGLVAGENNDCPDAAAPPGVISMTISGPETTGAGLVTFCIPRPDRLKPETLTLGTDVRIIDLNASNGSCSYSLDRTRAITGSVTGSGVCDDGADPRGFSLMFDGAASLRRTCEAVTATVDVQLQGQVAVAASPGT